MVETASRLLGLAAAAAAADDAAEESDPVARENTLSAVGG